MQTARQSRHGDVGRSSEATASSTLPAWTLRHGGRRPAANLPEWPRRLSWRTPEGDERRQTAGDRRKCDGIRYDHSARAVIVTETDIEPVSFFRRTSRQTVTAWRERRQINRPDDDGRHMTDGHGGRSGHDGRDSRGTPAQATTEKILGSSAGGWFHACRGNGWHIRYSLFQGLYSYPKRQKQKAKTKPLIFM